MDTLNDSIAYDATNKITKICTTDNNYAPKWSSSYSYNADGKVTQITGKSICFLSNVTTTLYKEIRNEQV